MKCTFKEITSKVTKPNTIGAFVKGFVKINIEDIPLGIFKWISTYEGISVSVEEDGLVLKAWATTTCSEKDQFNDEIGRRIAESKAKRYIYKFMSKFTEYLGDFYDAKNTTFSMACLKYEHCVEHETDYINSLGNAND